MRETISLITAALLLLVFLVGSIVSMSCAVTLTFVGEDELSRSVGGVFFSISMIAYLLARLILSGTGETPSPSDTEEG